MNLQNQRSNSKNRLEEHPKLKPTARGQGSVSESSSEASRPGSAPGTATLSEGIRSTAIFPGRKGKTPLVAPFPEVEHLFDQQFLNLLEEELTPNEVQGVLAVITRMRRNQNVMLKTEAVEGAERVGI